MAYFSRKLTSSKQKRSTEDRELLAVYSSVRPFRCMLEGHQFTIFTYHKPLTFAHSEKGLSSPRQERQLEYIAQFFFFTDIQYISDTENVADTLLRLSQISLFNGQYYENMAKAQLKDEAFKILKGGKYILSF